MRLLASTLGASTGRSRFITVDKPKPFDGTMGEPIHDFITTYEAWFRSVELNEGRELSEPRKIDAALHRTTHTIRKALLREQKEQKWTEWKTFKEYLINTYGTTDSPLERYIKFLQLRQHDNESIAEYTVRFREESENQAHHLSPEGAWRDNLHYLARLNGKMQSQMPTFPEYKNIEKEPFATVVGFAKRVEESIRASTASSSRQAGKIAARAGSGTPGSSSAGSRQGPGGKFTKAKGRNGVTHQTPYDTSKLTPNESKFLEANIQRGGGLLLREALQKKRVWVTRAMKENRCIKCAAVGHRADACSVETSASSKNNFEQVNTLAAEMESRLSLDSEMQDDLEYLYSIATSASPLAMYKCIVNSARGTALGDFGATRVYVSRKYAEQANLKFIRPEMSTVVKLASGQKMTILGYCSFDLTLGEWTGPVKAAILDIKADFDIVLGMQWFRQWQPVIDWGTLSMYVNMPDGAKLIPHEMSEQLRTANKIGNPSKRELKRWSDIINVIRDECAFNFISEKVVKKDLKRGTQAILYYVRESDLSSSIAEISTSSPWQTDNPRISKLLYEFKDVFREDLPQELPPHRDVDHVIDTGDHAPVNKNAYPLSVQMLREQQKQVGILLEKKLIRESTSPWGAPVLFVKKPKTDEWRMCIDYRALNARTRKNTYPLPRINECIDKLGKACRLSSLDLLSGYWHVRVANKDVQKTAFNTRYGKYEFLVMPFGLTNAPATFQTLMNQILRPYIDKFVLVYLDDILVYSNSEEEHVEHLRLVLEALRKHKLYARPRKCSFDKPTVEFCGHEVGQGVVRVLDSKVKAIRDWPQPRTVHEVRQFYGLVNYYRRFIKHFSMIGAPLSSLFRSDDGDKRRNRPVIWNTSHQTAFERLKRALTSAPVLIQPDEMKPYWIETDSSDFANGMCLMQVGEDGKLHPIAYDGRKLHGAELRYPTHEKELQAIKEALLKWHQYIDNGLPITIITDHDSLKYMNTMKNPSKRLARWLDEFQQYNLIIKYRPGEQAIVPDAISRRPDYFHSIRWERDNQSEIARREAHLPAIREFLANKKLPEDVELRKHVMEDAEKYILEEDTEILHRKIREGVTAPFIEFEWRGDLMQRMHDEYGHLTPQSLTNILESRAWWPSIERDLKAFAAACPKCQIHQRQRIAQEKEYAQIVTDPFIQPFQRWGIDLIGRLPKTAKGNRWIITAVDYATGWPIAKAIPKATEEAIAEFIYDEIYLHYGAPQEIFTDGGKNLWGGVVQAYLKKIGTHHKGTSPYHPRTNGKVERLNGIVGGMLSKYMLGKPLRIWDLYLDQALFACRVRTSRTTKTSPFYLVYGQQPRLIGDPMSALPNDATPEGHEKRLQLVQSARAQAAIAAYEDAVRSKATRDAVVKPHDLDEGQWVLVRHENPKKFESKWFGPYQVIEKMPLGTYRLQDPKGSELAALVHGNRLLKANISTAEELRDLWSSPAARDRLRRVSARAEIIPSFPENTDVLNRHLMEDGEDEPVSDAPLVARLLVEGLPEEVLVESVDQAEAGRASDSPALRIRETQDEKGPRFTLHMNLKRLREQEALDDALGQPAEKRRIADRDPE